MADVRKDQNEAVTKAAEATRAGARETANRTEEAVRTGIEGVRRVTEEFSKTFGFTAQNPDLTRQATRNLEAITETGSVLVRGFQEISREWIELAQERLRKNTEGLARLAQCRNVPDFAAVQSELVRENLREMIDNTRRIAEHSMQVAQEAAQVITAETGKAAERFRRAA